MDAALAYRTGGAGPKATLLALIGRMGQHGDEWMCWPSQATMADDSEQTERTVRSHLRAFEELGLIEVRTRVTGVRARGNVYVLNLDTLMGAESVSGAETISGGDDRKSDASTTGSSQPDDRKPQRDDRQSDAPHIEEQLDEPQEQLEERVFAAWVESTGKTQARLDVRRRGLIRRALRDYSVDDVLAAVVGWKNSAWHSGKNPDRKVYNDLRLVLRDAEHIEQFIEFARALPARRGSQNIGSFEADVDL